MKKPEDWWHLGTIFFGNWADCMLKV